MARDVVSEAYCKTEPLIDIFRRIGCASEGSCPTVVTKQKIGKTKLFSGPGVLWRSTIGWISFKGGSAEGNLSSPDLTLSRVASSDFALPNMVDAQECTNVSSGDSVFQVVGSGLVLDRVSDGVLTICLRTSPAIGVCLDNYPTPAFARMDGEELRLIRDVNVSVVDKTQELCASLDATGLQGVGIVPIRLESNYSFPLSVVFKLRLNDLQNKRLFTDARFRCLQVALSDAVGTGVSTDDIRAQRDSIRDDNGVTVTMVVSLERARHVFIPI
jgi:hypothetical protein